LGTAITEAVLHSYGASQFLARMSDPFWFQALGCVMGMDWHSSGITTSVLNALKHGLNPLDTGIMICGGRGRHSHKTPDELRGFAGKPIWMENHLFVPAVLLRAWITMRSLTGFSFICTHLSLPGRASGRLSSRE
jgi:hypothetical protein